MKIYLRTDEGGALHILALIVFAVIVGLVFGLKSLGASQAKLEADNESLRREFEVLRMRAEILERVVDRNQTGIAHPNKTNAPAVQPPAQPTSP